MKNEDVAYKERVEAHEERVEFQQQMNGYLRLTEFQQAYGFWLDSKLKLRHVARSTYNLGRRLVQKPKIPVVTELDVRIIARLIDEFGWVGTPIYPRNIMLFPDVIPWLDIQNVANNQGVAIFRTHIEEDQQSGNELIAAHDLLRQFSVAHQEVQQLRRDLIRCNKVFVSAGARLASEQYLPIMRARDVDSVVTLINEFGYNGIPQPVYPDAPMLLKQPDREEVQVIMNMVDGRFHVYGQL